MVEENTGIANMIEYHVCRNSKCAFTTFCIKKREEKLIIILFELSNVCVLLDAEV